MAVEIQDLIARSAADVVAWADSTLTTLVALFSAGMPNSVDPGALAAGGAAAATAGGAAAANSGRGDRGFRYTGSGDNIIRDSPSGDGTVVGTVPSGLRLVYDRVVRDANGTPTHYHVEQPGMRPGYIPAGDTSATPPTYGSQPPPTVLFPRDESDLRGISPNTTSARG